MAAKSGSARHGEGGARRFDAEACVLGAGAAGLAAGKALADRAVSFDWFEQGTMVGGLWRIDNDNGGSPAYQSLHTNTSRPRTQYPSYPMPSQWPEFPHHGLVAEYFQRFAEEHGLLERITFGTAVDKLEPIPGAGPPGSHGWAVTTSAGEFRTYRNVVVATGHHSAPRMPVFDGEFTGQTLHSHDYDEPSIFEGKDALIVGIGNSGIDIACEATKVARSVHLSARSGVHVVPKRAFGRPVDQFGSALTAFLPFPVERTISQALVRLAAGRPQDHGLPTPDHRLLHGAPAVSAELYDKVDGGEITIRPGVRRLEGETVRFLDGVGQHVDVIVFATGYEAALPFLSPEVFDPATNEIPLHLRVLSPERPGLYFVGLIQTLGSSISLMEHQSTWVGDLIAGAASLPSDGELRRRIRADQAVLAKRFVRFERNPMQVDYWRYRRALRACRGPAAKG